MILTLHDKAKVFITQSASVGTSSEMRLPFLLIFAISATSAAEFASGIYKEVADTQKGNFVLSPLSAEIVLLLTLFGCRGETAYELSKALHFHLHQNLEAEVAKLETRDISMLYVANKIYLDQNFTIRDGFKKVATEVFKADVGNVDFGNSTTAAKAINSWVAQQTNNTVQDLIGPKMLTNSTQVVLVDALYFQSDWLEPFHLRNTKKISFFRNPTDYVEVEALHSRPNQFFRYYECPRAKFLELPFKNPEASMVLVLPKDKKGLGALEKRMDRIFGPHNLTSTRVNVVLPKFQIKSSIDLKGALQKLGVKLLFQDFKADLSGIAGKRGDLVVGHVFQKSFVNVSEAGVEAAAVTFDDVKTPLKGYKGRPKEFIADHPFIFYIKFGEVIAFAGRVTDPTE